MPGPSYESLVDPTHFQTLVDYLESPESPIHYVIHTNSRSTLLEIAEKLGQPMSQGSLTFDYAMDVLADHVARGTALLTARRPDPAWNYSFVVPVETIPRHTLCHVIFMPPFYLSATHGLFERLGIQQTEAPQIASKSRRRMKI